MGGGRLITIISKSQFICDKKGVEGIPLKLIIVLLIMAITIPITWRGLETYDRAQTENNLRSELEFLSTNIKQVYLSGVGNAKEVEVDFDNGIMTKIDWIEIGDSVSGLWSTIRYKLGFKGREFIIIKDPNVPLGNLSDGDIGPLILGAGKQKIRLECREGLDFDDDGTGDMYIEVTKVI
jgi:hypothetical protein